MSNIKIAYGEKQINFNYFRVIQKKKRKEKTLYLCAVLLYFSYHLSILISYTLLS